MFPVIYLVNQMTELNSYISLNTKRFISEPIFLANLLASTEMQI